jgi:hypothetical protein
MSKDRVRVYLLHHTIDRGDMEDDKIIGIYSTQANAERAVERLKGKPGFRLPNGRFTIGPYVLGMDYWSDGFGED